MLALWHAFATSLSAPLHLDASYFEELLRHRSVTTEQYEGLLLSTLPSTKRGNILKALGRSIDMTLHEGSSFDEPRLGTCVDGRPRGQNQAEYDWERDGLRVACKSCQLKWNGRRWLVQLVKVKLHACDELQLMIYSPAGIFLYKHDRSLGVCRAGAI